MDYHSFGQELVKNSPDSRTISGMLNDQKIWIKQPVPPKARIWHNLQRGLAATIDRPILRATVSKGGSEALYMEAERLRDFKRRQFHVPEVLAVYDDMMVLTDMGPQLRHYLDKTKDMSALSEAMNALARLHAGGLAHGRPYMRDMTWDGYRIGFLDLEEDPARVMPIHTAQARDLWIFLSAASRYARRNGEKKVYEGPLIHNLFNVYSCNASAKTIGELKSFVAFLRPLRAALDTPAMWSVIGSDARQSVYINRCLEGLLL